MDRRRGWLFVLPWHLGAVGGVNQVVRHLVAGVASAYDPVVLCYSSTPDGGEPTGARIVYRPSFQITDGAPLLQKGKFLLRCAIEAMFLLRLLRRHRIAVANVHYPTTNATPLLALRKLRLFAGPVVVSVHGADIEAMPRRMRLSRFVLAAADHVVACSKALGDRLKEVVPATAPLTVIHNGLSLDGFPPAPEARRGKLIFCPARYHPAKGLDVLLRAFAMLDDKETRLAIVGPKARPDYVAELEALAEELGVRPRITFRDGIRRADLAAYFAEAACLALPSRAEPFGLVLLEAAYFGTPVVASKVGGIPEIIPDPTLATLVPPDDPAALGRALGDVLADPPAAAARAAKLRQRVMSRFLVANTVEAYLRLAAPAAR